MNRWRTQAAVAVAVCLIGERAAYGWGCSAHRLVGALAAGRLAPSAAATIGRLTDGKSLAEISCWADVVRPQRQETKRWHYVDIPRSATAYAPTRDCAATDEGDCLLAALDRSVATLRSSRSRFDAQAEALRFLVHLLADLHQPLHCTDDHDAGGNRVKVTFLARPTNLHAVWDRDLIEATQAATPGLRLRIATAVRAIPRARRIAFNLWALETHGVGVTDVYAPLPTNRRLGPEYVRAHGATVETQLARAAARLGDTLNLLFATTPARPARRPERTQSGRRR